MFLSQFAHSRFLLTHLAPASIDKRASESWMRPRPGTGNEHGRKHGRTLDHRLPDGVGTNRGCTDGPHLFAVCNMLSYVLHSSIIRGLDSSRIKLVRDGQYYGNRESTNLGRDDLRMEIGRTRKCSSAYNTCMGDLNFQTAC